MVSNCKKVKQNCKIENLNLSCMSQTKRALSEGTNLSILEAAIETENLKSR